MLQFKLRSLLVCCLVFLLLANTFQFLAPVCFASSNQLNADKDYWMHLATKAWEYYKPGVGVNANTGLHCTGIDYNYFTFWDLGVYINAILDAKEIGLISSEGTWGANYRFEKLLSWLETMELNPNNQPYLWYETNTGLPAFSLSRAGNNAYDYGHFLVAMARASVSMPQFSERIFEVVLNRLNTGSLVNQVGGNRDYTYYVAHGFAFFGYNTTKLTGELNLLSTWEGSSKVSMYGILLPKTRLICEPLLLGVFAFGKDEPLLRKLMYDIYLVHEARFNETGKFCATSEGNTGLSSEYSYVYEHVVGINGEPWIIYPNSYTTTSVPITPVAYFKVAVSFLALYNTSYARAMVDYLEPRLATPDGLFSAARGYKDGIDEQNRIVGTVVDKTNGLILAAANYALEQIQSLPTPTPTPSSSSPVATASFSPTASSLPTSALTPLPSSTLHPMPSTSTINESPTPLSSPSVSEPANSLSPVESSAGDVSSLPSSSATVSASHFTFSPSDSSSLPTTNLSQTDSSWLYDQLALVVLAFAVFVLILLIAYIIKRQKKLSTKQ